MYKRLLKKIIPFLDINEKIYKRYKKYNKSYMSHKSEYLCMYYNYKIFKKYNIEISCRSFIEDVIKFPHLIGIVIGAYVKIGKNCTIYQNVTLGRKNQDEDFAPSIGNNVTIYSGAKVIGNVKIGNNVVIGANSVVTKDVPDNSVVAGVPAKIIKGNVK